MKTLFILLAMVNSELAFGDGYYGRFWRGEARKSYPTLRNYCDDRNSDCFIELVNRWLIPATPSYAAEKALMTYAPVLFPKNLQEKYHDEIALILYDSESRYRDLRSDSDNLEGITYGPIHGDIFDMGIKGTRESSRSLVPKIFNGKVHLEGELKEVSYDLTGERLDLINSNGLFQLIERDEINGRDFLTRAESYLNDIKNTKEVVGAFALITENYLMIYIFVNEVREIINPKGISITWETSLKRLNPIQRHPLLYERIGYGEGGNLYFQPGVKPGNADHYRLHKK